MRLQFRIVLATAIALAMTFCCFDLDGRAVSGRSDPVVIEFPATAHKAIREQELGSPVILNRAEAEAAYWSLAKALQTATPPTDQREIDALIAEQVSKEVSPEDRYAALECANRIRANLPTRSR